VNLISILVISVGPRGPVKLIDLLETDEVKEAIKKTPEKYGILIKKNI
jgi:hypothetical protein